MTDRDQTNPFQDRSEIQRQRPNPERLQKRCPDCLGTGRMEFWDGTPLKCDMCGGEGALP